MYKICEESKRYNIFYKRNEKMYHDIAVKLGISDTVFWIFHSICEYGDTFTQKLLVDYLQDKVAYNYHKIIESKLIKRGNYK